MAGDLQIQVTISPQLRRALNDAYLMGHPTRRFLQDWTTAITDDAIKIAPEFSGDLKKSHKIKLEGGEFPHWGKVIVDSPYAMAVHEGQQPHWVPIESIFAWAYLKGLEPYAVQRTIARKGTYKQPWLKTAAQGSTRHVSRLIRRLGSDIAKRWEG